MGPLIPNLSAPTAPLRELLKEENRLRRYPAHQEAFNDIKVSISSTVTLMYFDQKKVTTLQVDVSMKGLGAALIQDGRPVKPLQMLKKDIPTSKENYKL